MPNKSLNNRATQEFDREVGNRLRSYRNHAGKSQDELGIDLGVTFQQIQKYEKGTNRLSFGRAVQCAVLFNVDLREFAGLNGVKVTRAIESIDFKLAEEFGELDPAMKPDALSILRLLNKNVRTKVVRKRK